MQCGTFFECSPASYNVGEFLTSGDTMVVTLTDTGKAISPCEFANTVNIQVSVCPDGRPAVSARAGSCLLPHMLRCHMHVWSTQGWGWSCYRVHVLVHV